ncbi:hypothetical protein ACUNWD_12265 [Sunxiuqinia sp. A32]|uniref:hypothetical protein n=1 Tax=Sunxiuqinia sp. A32 TaxID=3461496 RepID=UPI004045BFB8
MANIRSLKKDIDYLVSQVVIDCFQYINHFEKADKDQAYEIIKEVLRLNQELRQRTNHPDGKDNPALVKKYYNKIGKDLLEGCDKAYQKLGKLVEKGS